MKRKTFLITISLLFFVTALFGQTSPVQPGGKAVTNFPALRTTNQLFDHKTGSYVGALDHLHLNTPATLQPEPGYSLQGGNGSKTKQHYLDVTILGQNSFGNGLALQTGSQLGFMTTGKTKGGAGKVSIKDTLKKFDLSQPFGPNYFTSKGRDTRNKVWPADLFPPLH
jgi:hypothetical protein